MASSFYFLDPHQASTQTAGSIQRVKPLRGSSKVSSASMGSQIHKLVDLLFSGLGTLNPKLLGGWTVFPDPSLPYFMGTRDIS